jgi:hypothetical protein
MENIDVTHGAEYVPQRALDDKIVEVYVSSQVSKSLCEPWEVRNKVIKCCVWLCVGEKNADIKREEVRAGDIA